MTEAFPLQWPVGRPRTKRPESSRFRVTLGHARDALFDELRMMGAKLPVLSTNLELRRDGLPYANQKQPEDKGVAVYFEWKTRQMAFCCDRWNRIEDNIQAIRHTIAALRGLDRWGTGDMVEAAFTGFVALPSPDQQWWEVLGVPPYADADQIREAYRFKARKAHPDGGGNAEEFQRIRSAFDRAVEALAP